MLPRGLKCVGVLSMLLTALAGYSHAQNKTAVVTVRNPIAIPRPSETVALDAAQLREMLGVEDVRRIHVSDDLSAKDLLVQAVDLNDDGKFEELLFQTDLAANESRKFTVAVGAPQQLHREDFRAYGRFVQERRDDFAWENDRIAQRTYGQALETWAQEPLTSSAIDVWTKKTRRLVINDWYMVDDYHREHGEGGDFYGAGKTRGCGGSGIFSHGKLYPSANFAHSRLLANGPIRVMFELEYPEWDADGVRVSEIKRITLDAGQNLDRFDSRYTIKGSPSALKVAAGIRKTPRMTQQYGPKTGVLHTWEPLEEGNLGCAVIFSDASSVASAADSDNHLLVAPLPADGHFTHYAGFGWDQSGDFKDAAVWEIYVNSFAERLRHPVLVSLKAR
jgi:Domain of unknown function (DUF4861)